MDFDYSQVSSTIPYTAQEPRNLTFYAHQPERWCNIVDQSGSVLPIGFNVWADKGFIFSSTDDAFIVKKKNHFQVTVDVTLPEAAGPHFIFTARGLEKIDSFFIEIYGCKSLNLEAIIPIMQSNSDRSKKPLKPQKLDLDSQQSKTTIGRLHFSQTTLNNTRRNGKPNPGQQYFLLVGSLVATVAGQNYTIVSSSSDRLIVRTSPVKSDGDVSGECLTEEIKRRDQEKRQLMMEISYLRERLAYVKSEPVQTEVWPSYN